MKKKEVSKIKIKNYHNSILNKKQISISISHSNEAIPTLLFTLFIQFHSVYKKIGYS